MFFHLNRGGLPRYKIRDGIIMMDEGKVKAITEWEVPTNVKELRSFWD